MLAAAPGQRATVGVALAVMEASPRKRSVGYVRIVPPPAMAFITPAPAEEKSRAVIWPAVMRKAGILWWRLQRPHPPSPRLRRASPALSQTCPPKLEERRRREREKINASRWKRTRARPRPRRPGGDGRSSARDPEAFPPTARSSPTCAGSRREL